MLSIMSSPQEIGKHIAKQAQAKRLSLNLSQETLAERSGVSWGTLKKFERSGKISLESLLKLALALGCLQDFDSLFKSITGFAGIPQLTPWLDFRAASPVTSLTSINDLFKDKQRKRGRQ